MRHRSDQELFDPEPEPCPVQEGTVGWPGSPEVTELGTEAGDGMTFVRVTLNRVGHVVGAPTSDDGQANGYRILARPMGPGWRVPKRGERVLVVFPGGDWESPGNAVILGTIGASPSAKFGRRKTVQDFGDDDLVITAKSITLIVDRPDDGGTAHRHMLSVSERGGVQVVSDGSGLFAQDGEVSLKAVSGTGALQTSLLLNQTEITAMDNTTAGSTATVTLKGGNVTLLGQFVSVIPGTAMKFGKLASPATPILLGPTGFSAVPSTFIWGAVSP